MMDYRYIPKEIGEENGKAYMRFECIKMVALSVLVHIVVLLIVINA